jgi:peptide/nickel transport system ATP-binding protein
MSTLVAIDKLSVDFATGAGTLHALRDVTLDIPAGRIVGIVGESGSGKSTLALALLRLLPGNLARLAGAIRFAGQDLVALPEPEMQRLRGTRIAMIFQDPMTALNPVFTIGTQLVDAQRARRPAAPRRELLARAAAMLAKVGIADAGARLDSYPHQFSGGMRQRIMIAMALLAEPDLLIADEPTTALDVTIEAQIVRLLEGLREEFRGTILFISHSLGLVSSLCDDVVVMYAGTVVETAPARSLFRAPKHPYTRALLACEVAGDARDDDGSWARLQSIPGTVPSLVEVPPGCIFAPRCELRIDDCLRGVPALRPCAPEQRAACIRA